MPNPSEDLPICQVTCPQVTLRADGRRQGSFWELSQKRGWESTCNVKPSIRLLGATDMKNHNPFRIAGIACVAGTTVLALSAQAHGQYIANSRVFPPTGANYMPMTSADTMIHFGTSPTKIRNLRWTNGSGGRVPEPPGVPYQIDSFFDVFTEISFDGGANWFPSQHSGNTIVIRGTAQPPVGGVEVIATELLAMDLQGVAFPGCNLRLSQTLPSPGHTTLTDVGGGNYQVDSFFDIFTEISLDGGTTWTPATNSVRLGIMPEPATLASLGVGFVCLIRNRRNSKR